MCPPCRICASWWMLMPPTGWWGWLRWHGRLAWSCWSLSLMIFLACSYRYIQLERLANSKKSQNVKWPLTLRHTLRLSIGLICVLSGIPVILSTSYTFLYYLNIGDDTTQWTQCNVTIFFNRNVSLYYYILSDLHCPTCSRFLPSTRSSVFCWRNACVPSSSSFSHPILSSGRAAAAPPHLHLWRNLTFPSAWGCCVWSQSSSNTSTAYW